MNHVLFVSFLILLFGIVVYPKGNKKKKRKHNLILYKGGKSDN